MLPSIINGNNHQDARGSLKYNNNFNLSSIKRMYVIENANIQLKRGWQGHKIEQRWFTSISGRFEIKVIKVDNWENPCENLEPESFELNSKNLDVLHIPKGYITCIQAQDENSKLLIMSDYILGDINDEYKFTLEHFDCSKNDES